MRRSEAAVALIRREQEGRSLWLARWNAKWRAFHLVAGHRNEGESFRDCLVREVEEELGLVEGKNSFAASEPVARLEFDAFSESRQVETHYRMELFTVEIPGAEAMVKVGADPENRWLSGAEIRQGRANDGRPISPTMLRLLNEIDLLDEPGEGTRNFDDRS